LNTSLANAILLEEQLHHIALQPGFDQLNLGKGSGNQTSRRGTLSRVQCEDSGFFSSPKSALKAPFNLRSVLALYFRQKYSVNNITAANIDPHYTRWSTFTPSSDGDDGELAIGSKSVFKNHDVRRISYNIRYDLIANDVPEGEPMDVLLTPYFGRVDEFLEHECHGEKHYLALVRTFETTTTVPETDIDYDIQTFGYDRIVREGPLEIIDVANITCSIGILKAGEVSWIIDRGRGVKSVVSLFND
jgi:hypothetical protein